MVRESQPPEGKVWTFPLDEPEPEREEENQAQDPQVRMTNMIKNHPVNPPIRLNNHSSFLVFAFLHQLLYFLFVSVNSLLDICLLLG